MVKLDREKIYKCKFNSEYVEVPRHELFTKGGRILLRRQEPKSSYKTFKVEYDPNIFCWEDEGIFEHIS